MPVAEPDVHLDPADLATQLAEDVRRGLAERPRTLPPKYFYDGRGSELFDAITRLPEYYPTRTERAILEGAVAEVASASGAQTLVELGSGTSDKTRLLLSALRAAGTLRTFVPFDVDPVVLEQASEAVAEEFPGLVVSPVVGDFERHLGKLPGGGRRLVAFLGSTIGNLDPGQRSEFLGSVRSALGPGDSFLLGTDLVKDPARLVAAYDDAAGVTAEFNRNVLAVVNRSLGADFELEAFDHVAAWDAAHEWVEMRLRSRRDQQVRLPAIDLRIDLAAGEEIRTEISAKFRREGIGQELSEAGFALRHWWTDPAGDYALSLSSPV